MPIRWGFFVFFSFILSYSSISIHQLWYSQIYYWYVRIIHHNICFNILIIYDCAFDIDNLFCPENLYLGCFRKINLYGIFKTGFFFKKLSTDKIKKLSFLMLLWLQSLEIYVTICLHFASYRTQSHMDKIWTHSEIPKILILLNLSYNVQVHVQKT